MSLKESIAHKHKLAESHPFSKLMIEGKLTQGQYLLYLIQMVEIFSVIENKIDLPSNAQRLFNVVSDINELIPKIGENESMILLSSTESYSDHLNELKGEQIMAHVYLNYLALVFGGQMIKKSVPGSGSMYDFEDPSEIISYVRSRQKDEWADEANLGLDYTIAIYDELQKVFGFEG